MGQLNIYPFAILDRHAVKHDNVAVPQFLIKWTNLSDENSSWEDYHTIATHYPQFILEDKNAFERGRMLEEEIGRRTAVEEEGRSEAERSKQFKTRADCQARVSDIIEADERDPLDSDLNPTDRRSESLNSYPSITYADMATQN
jgi:Chromo (CHRromatin Organisation MOdifier) domain